MPLFFDYPMAIQPFTPPKYSDMFIPPTELGIYDELKPGNYLLEIPPKTFLEAKPAQWTPNPEWYKLYNELLRNAVDKAMLETNPFQVSLDMYPKKPKPFDDEGWSIETPETE